ncbi:hypothetical protein EZS27_022105 [termite gut metagenome]|uniref:Uncharacterized protein n=1 Tax=termite gut metagenome TaxID=433724 RepID=A0A5J4R5T5_9ZZZZ
MKRILIIVDICGTMVYDVIKIVKYSNYAIRFNINNF